MGDSERAQGCVGEKYQNMEVESNSLKAVNMIHNIEPHPIDTAGFPVINDIILKCRNLIRMHGPAL